MNLREHLRILLPEILPDDPADSIKGTELIRLVRLRLGDGYSDATLRYHFSILSYDPTSPIAKVDQGQGYYQRQKKAAGFNGAVRQGFFDDVGEGDQTWSRFLRLVAIYERLCLLRSRYPFLLNRNSNGAPSMEGEWDVPDLVVAEWDLDPNAEDGARFDRSGIGIDRVVDEVEFSRFGIGGAVGEGEPEFQGEDFLSEVGVFRGGTLCEVFEGGALRNFKVHVERIIDHDIRQKGGI